MESEGLTDSQLKEININMLKCDNCPDTNQKLTIIPTIDISKGRAVLVCQGKVVKDNGDPVEQAEFLSINSDFQVVDLDRAMEAGDNSEIIKKICQKYPCYVAGGIRNYEIANEFLNNNAKRVVIGTKADVELLSKLPKNRLILALDIDEEFKLFKRGRKELSTENVFDKIDQLGNYVSLVSVTFHFAEGKGKGCDIDRAIKIKRFIDEKGYRIRMAVAGGINSVEEIGSILELGVIPQFGLGL